MSFDLLVWDAHGHMTLDEARDHYEQIVEGALEPTEESATIDRFLDELKRRYPDIDECSDQAMDSCPWANGIERGDRHVCLNIQWSRADEVATAVIELALRFGLVCYDPQQGAVHQPMS